MLPDTDLDLTYDVTHPHIFIYCKKRIYDDLTSIIETLFSGSIRGGSGGSWEPLDFEIIKVQFI